MINFQRNAGFFFFFTLLLQCGYTRRALTRSVLGRKTKKQKTKKKTRQSLTGLWGNPGSAAFGCFQSGVTHTTIVSCLRAWSRSAAPLVLLSKRALPADQSAATLRGQEVTCAVPTSVKCTVSPQILSTYQHLSCVRAGGGAPAAPLRRDVAALKQIIKNWQERSRLWERVWPFPISWQSPTDIFFLCALQKQKTTDPLMWSSHQHQHHHQHAVKDPQKQSIWPGVK